MITSWIVSSSNYSQRRWDHGYQAFQRGEFLDQWSKKYGLSPLGDIIFDDSYGILTPGDVYEPDNPITYVRVSDMRENLEIDFSQALRVPDVYFRHERAILRINDVLMAIKGASIASNKSVGFIAHEPLKTIVNGTIFRFQVKEPHNPFFVATMLESEILKGQIRNIQISNNAVSYVDKPSIHALQIPLPPRPIQDQITQIMQDAYAVRAEKLKEIEILLGEMEAYVFSILKMTPQSIKEETHFLKPVRDMVRSRFDVDFNLGFHKFDSYQDRVTSIQEIASFPKEIRDPSSKPDQFFCYIDIASINIKTGEITTLQEIVGKEAPSRARQVVHTGDVIISTVRPTRGAIAIIEKDMDDCICTTGFVIIHPNEKTSSEYLHTILRLSTTLEQFGRRSAGSSYPAILEKDIKETLIPLPTKDLQTEITTEVSSRRKLTKQLQVEANEVVSKAKELVEQLILGNI